jgi:hypothetical protein
MCHWQLAGSAGVARTLADKPPVAREWIISRFVPLAACWQCWSRANTGGQAASGTGVDHLWICATGSLLGSAGVARTLADKPPVAREWIISRFVPLAACCQCFPRTPE